MFQVAKLTVEAADSGFFGVIFPDKIRRGRLY